MKTKIRPYELGQGFYIGLIRSQIDSIVDPLKKLDFPKYSNDEQRSLEIELVLFSTFSIMHTLRYKMAEKYYNEAFSGFGDLFYEDLQEDLQTTIAKDKNKFREFLYFRHRGYDEFFNKQFKNITSKTQDSFALMGLAEIFYKNAIGREPNAYEMHLMNTVLFATFIATGRGVKNILESYEII